MGRLSDTLKIATDAKAGLETAVEQNVAKYVERVQLIHRRQEDVFLEKHGELDLNVSELVEFQNDIEEFGKNDRSGDGKNSGNAYDGTNKKA